MRDQPGFETSLSSFDIESQQMNWNVGGNPAIRFADSIRASSAYSLTSEGITGSLRRVLDPTAVSQRSASLAGNSGGAEKTQLVGVTILEQQAFSAGSLSDVANPYASSPLATFDTSTSATRNTRITLEGLANRQLGHWTLGAGFGLANALRETESAALVKRLRESIPAATFGAEYSIGALSFGPYARWRHRIEVVTLTERESEGGVFQVEGIRDVPILDILERYMRRTSEDVYTIGASARGIAGNLDWHLYAERSLLRQKLTRQETNEPRFDRWNSSETGVGAGLNWRGKSRDASLELHYAAPRSYADVGLDSAGAIVRLNEHSVRAIGRLGEQITGAPLKWMIRATAALDDRAQDELRIPMRIGATGLTLSADGMLARQLGQHSIIGAAGAGHYAANARFPSPAAFGNYYLKYVVPDLDLGASKSISVRVMTGYRWDRARATYWIDAALQRLSVSGPRPTAFGPAGQRRCVTLVAGVRLRNQ